MKPILFSTEMVRAILDGRKTQFRRALEPQPVNVPDGAYIDPYNHNYNSFTVWTKDNKMCLHCGGDRENMAHWKAPYQPGYILWVRETWGIPVRMAGEIIYRADYADKKAPLADGEKWRPSIHMPKDAARIFLLVKAVRVERLQEIAEADAIAEGAETDQYLEFLEWATSAAPGGSTVDTVRDNFTHIWNRLNARRGYGWDTNPWVWVIEFEEVDKP